MKSIALVGFCLFFSGTLVAQKGNDEQKAAIQKLQWMIGNWAGSSLVTIDNKKVVTNIRETVQPSLDGTILLIQVKATDKDTTTQHQSLAYTSFSVISYDAKNKTYLWTSWRTNGDDYEQEPFTVGTHSFEYALKENGKTIRYKANLGERGEFLETGEYRNNNTDWVPFITMKLAKHNAR